MGDDDHRNFVGARRVNDVDEERSRREAFARRLTGPPSSAPRARSSVPPMMPSRPPTRSTLPAPPSKPPPAAVDPIDAIAADHLTAARTAAKLRDLPLAARHYRAATEATDLRGQENSIWRGFCNQLYNNIIYLLSMCSICQISLFCFAMIVENESCTHTATAN